MKTVLVATKGRGFLETFFNNKFDSMKFIYEKNKIYETNSKLKKRITKIVRSRFADYVGLIQVIDVKNEDSKYNYVFSYNRFLKTNKPYILYVENPLALVHYSTGRPDTVLSKRKLKKFLNDDKLKAIVCMSKACYETFPQIYDLPDKKKLKQIYPFITNENKIKKDFSKELQCLYISSDFYLKGGSEIIEAHKKIKKENSNIRITVVTKLDKIKPSDLKYINDNRDSIEIVEFNLSKKELSELYKKSHVLLNVSRQDSFSLVALEAMKYGNVILSTDLYALPEMVENNFNGFLIGPKYRFFREDNMPNIGVWNDRRNTIYSDFIDLKIVDFLVDKIKTLDNDRNLLLEMGDNSFNKATNSEFDSMFIESSWEDLFNGIEE